MYTTLADLLVIESPGTPVSYIPDNPIIPGKYMILKSTISYGDHLPGQTGCLAITLRGGYQVVNVAGGNSRNVAAGLRQGPFAEIVNICQ